MSTHFRIAVSVVSVWALVTGVTAFQAAVGAQGKSVVDGVYSEAQAKRGTQLYAEQCASCHGEDMSGVAGLFPPLVGADFLKVWQGKSVGELFEKVQTTMPALDPGSLKPEQTADIVAYMLSHSKYPAGSADMATTLDPLKQILIDAPK
jgi:mono/diheme cytochrome c family protein